MKKCKCVSKTSPTAAANGCETLEGVRFLRQFAVKRKEKQSKNETLNQKKNPKQQQRQKNYFGPAVIVTKCISCLQARSEGNSF